MGRLRESAELREAYIAIKQLETELLQPEVRCSPDRLLADDFLEFGMSGKRYTKQDVVRLLPQSDGIEYQATDFEARQVVPNVVLLTYGAAAKDTDTGKMVWMLRSSLWKRLDNRWKLVFHKGTPQAE